MFGMIGGLGPLTAIATIAFGPLEPAASALPIATTHAIVGPAPRITAVARPSIGSAIAGRPISEITATARCAAPVAALTVKPTFGVRTRAADALAAGIERARLASTSIIRRAPRASAARIAFAARAIPSSFPKAALTAVRGWPVAAAARLEAPTISIVPFRPISAALILATAFEPPRTVAPISAATTIIITAAPPAAAFPVAGAFGIALSAGTVGTGVRPRTEAAAFAISAWPTLTTKTLPVPLLPGRSVTASKSFFTAGWPFWLGRPTWLCLRRGRGNR